ncbi:Mov34/MPN/PAD-1 family protein [Egibacter rhizosphaerae]|uniref:Mov34/MPN/PAD-1 family protein n=1 Tax=Egibacter rhizosphaerae TaxID=1670831 RepID=UPI00197A7931|nr:M67 family metallopeptidase [Egibacter rhizosphaerae]
MTRAELSGRLDLDRETFDGIVEHARSDTPYEVCGLLATDDGERVTAHYPVPNSARSMTYYNMDPKSMLHAMNDMDDHGWELLAIYHSHTHTEAFPSPTDVELAFYPDAVYLIVSLQDAESPVLRAFNIVDGKITERVLTVEGEAAAAGPR